MPQCPIATLLPAGRLGRTEIRPLPLYMCVLTIIVHRKWRYPWKATLKLYTYEIAADSLYKDTPEMQITYFNQGTIVDSSYVHVII